MNLIDKITSYVDNELKDQNLIDEVKDLINNNEIVRSEYFIQSNIKNLLKERFTNQTAPDYLKKRIINNIHFISTPVKKEKTKNIFINQIFEIRFAFAILALIVFILLVSMPFTPKLTTEILVAQQAGDNNLLVQTHNNFRNLVAGNLKAQHIALNREDLNDYFKNSGVKYSTSIPACPSWKAEGAVISEIDGLKLAHSIYKNDKGELLYIFQVDNKMIGEKSKLCMSDDLQNYISEGNYLKVKRNDCSIVIMKYGNNILAAASNSDLENIDKTFLTFLK